VWNDGNGLIDGRNYIQGSILLHQELSDAFPWLVLGGESVNELFAPHERFAQRWHWDPLPPHPISTFLLGDRTLLYGYLGQPGPEDPLT